MYWTMNKLIDTITDKLKLETVKQILTQIVSVQHAAMNV